VSLFLLFDCRSEDGVAPRQGVQPEFDHRDLIVCRSIAKRFKWNVQQHEGAKYITRGFRKKHANSVNYISVITF